jgi:hypothetical protein
MPFAKVVQGFQKSLRITKRGKQSAGVSKEDIFPAPDLSIDRTARQLQQGAKGFQGLPRFMDGLRTRLRLFTERLQHAIDSFFGQARNVSPECLLGIKFKCHLRISRSHDGTKLRPDQRQTERKNRCGQGLAPVRARTAQTEARRSPIPLRDLCAMLPLAPVSRTETAVSHGLRPSNSKESGAPSYPRRTVNLSRRRR